MEEPNQKNALGKRRRQSHTMNLFRGDMEFKGLITQADYFFLENLVRESMAVQDHAVE